MSAPDEILYLSIADLHRRYLARTLSPVEVVDAALARIEALDPQVNAFVTVTADLARESARRAEAELAHRRDPLPPLFGVPMGLKDLSDSLEGVRNTYGSRAFADFVSPQTADHVQRLLDAGAIPVGKTNTSEFGHRNTTDNHVTGPTSTPFLIGSNAGGSSGGSAAAVAAGMASVALGSDGGGSIRVPAAACGVYGFKPTFGQVPWTNRPNAFGTLAPFTHKGPIARSVADAVAMLDVLAQPHARDPFGPAGSRATFAPPRGAGVGGLRVAYLPTLCGLVPDADVAACVQAGAQAFADAGAQVDVLDDAIAYGHADIGRIWGGVYDVFAADTALGLRGLGFDIDSPDRALLSPSFLALVERGMALRAIDYQALNHERTGVLDAVDRLLATYDLLLTPTNAVAGIPNHADAGETFGPASVSGQPVQPLVGWSLTYLFNLTGHPVASVPVGLTPAGLPVGMQIVGRRHDDVGVLAASAAFERQMPWAGIYRRLG